MPATLRCRRASERKNERAAAIRVEAAKATTFKEFAEEYVATHKPGWRNVKHGQQWENTLRDYAYPQDGRHPLWAQ